MSKKKPLTDRQIYQKARELNPELFEPWRRVHPDYKELIVKIIALARGKE